MSSPSQFVTGIDRHVTRGDDRTLFALARIWCGWRGVRGKGAAAR